MVLLANSTTIVRDDGESLSSLHVLNNLLTWNATQGYILSGGGTIEKYYTKKMFEKSELPHELLQLGWMKLLNTFQKWCCDEKIRSDLVMGTWNRPLFMGGWKESTTSDTRVFNVQTPSLFVDLRFPLARPNSIALKRRSLNECTNKELRILARQHCFAGYSLRTDEGNIPICTRHHCIDWNFHPQFPRSRPNRWRIETNSDRTSFKEFGYAKDDHNQSIYMERWDKYENSDNGQYFGMLCMDKNAIFVVTGDHFGYAENNRPTPLPVFPTTKGGGCANLVDIAFEDGNRNDMIAMLNLEGSYGQISQGWEILVSTHPWREGESIMARGPIEIVDSKVKTPYHIKWQGAKWLVLESSFRNIGELQSFFSQFASKL